MEILSILIGVVILIAIFLIFREVINWYWKINERVNLQREQNSILNQILDELKNKSDTEKENQNNNENIKQNKN